jgi:serine/threonine-protein kinase
VAIVYKAFDQHLQREIALKTFPLSPRSGLNQEQLFLSQARVIARLSHPNIVTVYDCGHMDFLYYIAMEYAQGDNLREAVRKKGPLALEDARSILEQLADALIYAHSQQVLHLDVKPGNIILRHSGEIKVVDFGLAKILSEAAAKATANEDSQLTLVGTPQYMAPEQILGNAPDVRTDIYGLGLTLFYLLTGRTPFDARRISDPTEIARLQVHSSLPRPSTLRATLPEIVDEIFVKCTQKDPDDRYSDVRAFLEDISRL